MKKWFSSALAAAMILSGCQTVMAAGYTPGTYQGAARGAGGDVTVSVTFDAEKMTEVSIVSQTETQVLSDAALEKVPQRILEAQSTEVDGVAGATLTSNAIKKAVTDCILQATGQKVEGAAEAKKVYEACTVDNTYHAEQETNEYAKTIAWDAQYDVIVAGFGAGGATSAISAADNGATVLLTEKAPKGHEGGNTKYAGQDVMGPDSYEKGLAYYTALRGLFTNTSDSMLETWVKLACENPDYLISLGAVKDEFWVKAWPEFPEFEGSDSIYTWLVGGTSFQGTLYNLLQDNVFTRNDNIEVWYEAPGKHLIQDPFTKIILGMKIEKDGKVLNVRAKNGVVLACGGFEANQQMIQDFLQMPYVYTVAAVYNTGDGIKMAMEVGSDLWHMGNSAGYTWGFKPFDGDRAIRSLTLTNGIIVGPTGERFMNEAASSRHGKVNFGGSWISMPTALPAHYVFDSNGVKVPVAKSFSANNETELEKGYIVKADTLEELAEKIGVPAEKLAATVEKYNGYCANGEDVQYGRPAEKLVPVAEGPFYAMEIGPAMLNTQGGPRRNEKAEVLDVNGDAIPHLYSAGEMGALFCNMYNGGGNLGECVGFGRVAGANAAAPKAD